MDKEKTKKCLRCGKGHLSNFGIIYNLTYSIGKKDEYSVFERPTNIIGSFLFALFFYTLIILSNKDFKK